MLLGEKYYYEIKDVPYEGGIYILYTILPNNELSHIEIFNSITGEENQFKVPEKLEFRDTQRLILTTKDEFWSMVTRIKIERFRQ